MDKKEKYEVTGDTYKYKDKIRKAGGRWDAVKKCWIVELYKSDSLWRYQDPLIFTKISTSVKAGHGICQHCGTYCQGDCRA